MLSTEVLSGERVSWEGEDGMSGFRGPLLVVPPVKKRGAGGLRGPSSVVSSVASVMALCKAPPGETRRS